MVHARARPTRQVTATFRPSSSTSAHSPSSACGSTGIDPAARACRGAGREGTRARDARRCRRRSSRRASRPRRDRARPHVVVALARLVAVRERGVGARVVAVRLAQPRVRHRVAQADGVRLAQRLEERLGIAEVRQRLRVAQVRVRVHEADLAAEEGAGLGALEVALQRRRGRAAAGRTAARRRPRAGVAGSARRAARACSRREQVREDRVDHRQQAVATPRLAVARVQPVLDAPSSRKCARPATTPSATSRRWKSSRIRASAASSSRRAAARPQRRSAAASVRERLVVERDRPRAAQSLAQRGVGRLQRIVPVAVAVGGEARARDHAPLDQRERALDVREHGRALGVCASPSGWKNGSSSSSSAASSRGEQVLGEREQRPEDDVAVRVAGADARARARRT